jgi:proteasome activator subunit 4
MLPHSEPKDRLLDPDTELASLSGRSVQMNAGFSLTPGDARYECLMQHRNDFGMFLHRASGSLRSDVDGRAAGDEHIDAILSVIRAIHTFLLDYAATRNAYATQKKSYEVVRDLASTHSKQKYFPRTVWIRRAQV